MNIQQFAVIQNSQEKMEKELENLGFLPQNYGQLSINSLFLFFLKQCFPESITDSSKEEKLKKLRANESQNLSTYMEQRKGMVEEKVFYHVALQMLGFLEDVDYDPKTPLSSMEKLGLPIKKFATTDEFIATIYLFLQTHNKFGVNFLDSLLSKGYFKGKFRKKPTFFAGKAVGVFDTNKLIREVVYVECDMDTDEDGLADLIKVEVIRPDSEEKIPVLFTASPYNQGINPEANDRKLHDVNVRLERKEPDGKSYEEIKFSPREEKPFQKRLVRGKSQVVAETFTTEKSYSLNDYFLSRGFASVYATGIGGKESDGIMTCGSVEQTDSMKAVIEWLCGERVAFTNKTDNVAIQADWCNGRVAMTGKSYLGTLATAVATTGVEGLRTIVSEAGISSWYDYYRENGLVIAPGGFAGEDADVLAELTYSRMIDAGDFLQTKDFFNRKQKEMKVLQERETGNYNTFWDERNYLPNVKNISCDVVMVHGLNDWNVKPRHVEKLWQALREVAVCKKIILHQGQHIYVNNNRSLDFTDMMNLWFSYQLYEVENGAKERLPSVLWQDNTTTETWQTLRDFGVSLYKDSPLKNWINVSGSEQFEDFLEEESFDLFKANNPLFVEEIQKEQTEKLGKNRVLLQTEILTEDLFLNGSPRLKLKVKTSENIGLISARLLDFGQAKRLGEHPKTLELKALDRGVNFKLEDLKEFDFAKESPSKLISIGHINLQNRENPWKNDTLCSNEFVEVTFDLQPTIYKVPKGRKIGLVLYATDFEYTVRGNQKVRYTLELEESVLALPTE